MKYIQNNQKYAMSLNFDVNGVPKTFRFDARRMYQDTGNVATTGETPIDEGDVEYLLEHCEVFQKLVAKGDISVLEEPSSYAAEDLAELKEENASLLEENTALKEQIENAGSAKEKELKSKNKSLEKEIVSLKKRLEAAGIKDDKADDKATVEPKEAKATEATEATEATGEMKEDEETGAPEGF